MQAKSSISKLVIVLIGLSVIVVIGVAGLLIANFMSSSDKAQTEVVIVDESKEVVHEIPAVKEEQEEPKEEEASAIGPTSPLTGLPKTDDEDLRRPLVVMLDNYYTARPQAGLEFADIVYEFLAEGNITRYMAVFYSEVPDKIGPIRSARPYFIETALAYNPYYVHVGGSNDAFKLIKTSGIADIDGISSNPFWRVNHKVAPHNLYSSYEALIGEASRRKYQSSYVPEFLSFNSEFNALNGSKASEMTFVYKEGSTTSSDGYYSSYIYNNEEKLYYRYTNGSIHIDEASKNPLTCTNVLVQYAETKVLDSEGRLKVNVIGSGNGKYFTGGEYIDILWEKTSAETKTEFFKTDGTAIKLNPGKTWIQVITTNMDVKIKE